MSCRVAVRCAVVVGGLVLPATASASTTADVVTDDSFCALREAVISANTGIAAGSGCVADSTEAGFGSDTVHARNGKKEKVDCGAGKDRASVGRADMAMGCKTVRPARS